MADRVDVLPKHTQLYLPVYDQLLPTQSVICQVEYKYEEPGEVQVVQ